MLHHGTVSLSGKLERVKERARIHLDENPFGKLFTDVGAEIGRDELNDLQVLLTDRDRDDDASVETPAGFTFFGQFIDHDITLAALMCGVDDLRCFTPIEDFRNLRSPQLDLDSVFGLGPEEPKSKALFRPDLTLKTGEDTGGSAWDLPRTEDQVAIIGDPRNDENKILAQIHAGFIHAYNRMFSEETASSPTERYVRARLRLYTTYQYILLNDYLARFVDPGIMKTMLDHGAQRFAAMMQANGGKIVMPMEFAVAAFRFGHSQVRSRYLMNIGPNGPSAARLFSDDGRDLNGGALIDASLRLNHELFFSDTLPVQGPFNMARKIDAKLALPLFSLEPPSIPSPEGGHPHGIGTPANPRSLGHRNLLRSRQVHLLDGFQAASALGIQPLTVQELDLVGFRQLSQSPPLWYYILREAEIAGGRERLGPVGSHILCETFIGLMEHATNSYFRLYGRDWTPPGDLKTMAKLMEYADM